MRRSARASLDRRRSPLIPSITDRARILLQRTLDNLDVGVRILSVNLTDVNVPQEVQDAQRDAIKASKDRQRYQQEAELVPQQACCRGPARQRREPRELQDAAAYKLQVIALASRATPRAWLHQVLEQYEHAPAVTRERHVHRDHGKCLQELAQGADGYEGQ